MKDLSREEYLFEIKYCYENSRWEFSYYAVLYSYFCQFRNDKIKLVHCANWKSRGDKTSKNMKKNLKYCSIKCRDDKNGKEYIGEIPDFQFVPAKYSYGDPCEANAFIEFKAPNFSDEGNYKSLVYSENSQIKHEFEKCDKIIYTDGVTWFFLKKNHKEPEETINLIDNNDNWNVLKNKITNFITEQN